MTSRACDSGRIDCVGPLNMDVIIQGDAPTDPDQLANWTGPARVDFFAAGSIGYSAQALARLGWRVRLFSAVGDDFFGRQILRDLSDLDIDVAGIQTIDGPTSLAIYLMLFGGTKRPLTYRVSPALPWPTAAAADEHDDEPPQALFASGLLHFTPELRAEVARELTDARATGVVTAVDAQFPLSPMDPPWLPSIEAELAGTDILFCDELEARKIFGAESVREAVTAAISLGCRVVAVKLGHRGAVIGDSSRMFWQPAVDLGYPDRETVGAGDLFNGGFLAAWLGGSDITDAAAQATAIAACAVSAPDAHPCAITNLAEMRRRVPPVREIVPQ